MALRVWLPLNGNINNYGISDIAVTNNGATIDNNGKIGKCYSFNGSSAKISTSINLTPEMSFCAWVKFNSVQNFVIDARNSSGQGYQPMYISSTGVQIYSSGSPSGGYVSYSFSTNVWYHLVVSYSNNKGYLYVNGALVGTVGVASLTLDNSILTIGSRYSSENYLNGNLNDVRIYDHCLSPKEVKEISKGLCLHYKLAGPGQTNLLNTSQYYSGGNAGGSISLNGNEMTISSPGGQWDGYAFAYDHLKNSTNYILSFKTQKVSGTLTRIGGHDSGLVTSWELDGVTQSVAYSSTVSVADDFTIHKVVLHITTTSSSKGPIYFQVNRGNTTVCTQKFWDIKLTEGNQQVGPWCPAETELGYDNNIEDDCSGYCHNGAKSGTIIWDIDSPRYITSYKFNTGVDYIKSAFSLSMSELSCSFWVKPNSSNGGYSIIASNYNNPPSGFWLAINTEGSGVWFYNGSYVAGRSLLTNNVWHHCVFTFKNGIGTWYVNGTSVVSTDISSRGTSLSINNLTVGNSYTGTSWNTKNYGNISDFRVYATALSAADILELYEVGGAIDSHYNSYAYEFIEE